MENHTQNVAAPTAAPMLGALVSDRVLSGASSRRIDARYSGRPMTVPAVGATVHCMGQVSLAAASTAFPKVWAPPPRPVPL